MIRFALIFAWCMATTALAAAPTTQRVRPTERVGQEGCVRAECHADIRNYAHVHGPVGTNACDACHEPVDVEAHTFRLTREQAELCTFCHEFDVSHMPVIHKPVAQGECLSCHDPHGGTSAQLLREASVVELCHRCHESITRGRSFLHTPVAKGACESCHPPHAARFAKLLDLAGADLCLACHEDLDSRMQTATATHEAMKQGCEKCHDPHGSNHAMATTQPVAQQCSGCHEQFVIAAAGARNRHPPMSDPRTCLNCHTPHVSSIEHLVSDTPARLCANCHKDPIKSVRGGVIAAVGDPSAATGHVHGALKDGGCAGCHAPHGNNRADLLTRFYSTRLYQPFTLEHYELCFSCHDARLVTEQATTTFTAFRNGKTNLHTVHVALQGARSENCRACHITHSGGNERGVHERGQYGKWDMPMRFTRTATGGACFPGCHTRYEYDRERAVTNPAATRPADPHPRPRAQEPASVELRANDLDGSELRVPDPDRPTVLLLMRNDDRAAHEALLPLAANARIVAITGASVAAPWPTIADADGEIARQLDVSAWPTALLIGRDGSEIARVSGTITSIALKLNGYLADRTSQSPPTTRTAEINLAERSAALRELYRAETLIAANRHADAKEILLRIVPVGHHRGRAYYLLGQVLEHEGDWQGAARAYRAAREE